MSPKRFTALHAWLDKIWEVETLPPLLHLRQPTRLKNRVVSLLLLLNNAILLGLSLKAQCWQLERVWERINQSKLLNPHREAASIVRRLRHLYGEKTITLVQSVSLRASLQSKLNFRGFLIFLFSSLHLFSGNACGLYLKLHNVSRPKSMRNDTIKKRNRSASRASSSSQSSRSRSFLRTTEHERDESNDSGYFSSRTSPLSLRPSPFGQMASSRETSVNDQDAAMSLLELQYGSQEWGSCGKRKTWVVEMEGHKRRQAYFWHSSHSRVSLILLYFSSF